MQQNIQIYQDINDIPILSPYPMNNRFTTIQ
jgi:hypothetical protein